MCEEVYLMSKSETHNKEYENVASVVSESESNKSAVKLLQGWLGTLSDAGLAQWDRLPDIGLYMDQVLTLMDRQLVFYKRADDDKLLTQPMINNYTKDGLLPRASDKKYTQGHLALLSVLCSLKPVLSISDLSVLLENTQLGNDERKIYEFFLESQKEAIDSARKDLLPEIDTLFEAVSSNKSTSDSYRREMALMALRMAIEARVRIMMTQKILDFLSPPDVKKS